MKKDMFQVREKNLPSPVNASSAGSNFRVESAFCTMAELVAEIGLFLDRSDIRSERKFIDEYGDEAEGTPSWIDRRRSTT